MPTVRTDDGVRIAYHIHGTGEPTVLFLHGWAGSGAYWDGTLGHLDTSRLRAVTVDLRGHGDSDRPDAGYTLERFARDVWAVADHLGVSRVVLVGFSMSAKFAQYVSLAEPERVLGQVLVGGCPAAKVPLPLEVHHDWVARAGDRERLIAVTRMFLTRPVDPAVLERWGDDAVKVQRLALDETLKMCTEHSFAEEVSKLKMSTLAVGGIHDPIFTPDVMRHAVVAPLPRARLVLVDSNHEIPIEAPRELAGLIEAFLAGMG
jgi:pimeloyl-ACP methyl ester carboxylesterase